MRRPSTDDRRRAWAGRAGRFGTREIGLTSTDRDGTQAGYELEFTRRVSKWMLRS